MQFSRDTQVQYISPEKEVNVGLWMLFAGATAFLILRFWCKYVRHTMLWYDDYILILSWLVLMVNNIIITCEFATGYVKGDWDDRMHILINISSCGTLVGQAWSKTAFGVTLLRMSNRYQKGIIWFCIATMNTYMFTKVLFQWGKLCGRSDYQSWYRIQGFCIDYQWEQNFKQGGQIYNIIMDFAFALFPWWITWSLEMRKMEKIALCSTLSLGIVVAIISAARTAWNNYVPLHTHDVNYMWLNGMSLIWYASEISGTIIVQCIPIIRPFVRDIRDTRASFFSKRKSHSSGTRSVTSTWRSTIDGRVPPTPKLSVYSAEGKRISSYNSLNRYNDKKGATAEVYALEYITEEGTTTATTPSIMNEDAPTATTDFDRASASISNYGSRSDLQGSGASTHSDMAQQTTAGPLGESESNEQWSPTSFQSTSRSRSTATELPSPVHSGPPKVSWVEALDRPSEDTMTDEEWGLWPPARSFRRG